MSYEPIVSIIIPLYNSQSDIIDCLKSILKQTYDKYEIIIIDDGSTDNSVVLVAEFINEHPEIQFKFFQQDNSGPSKARNMGILNSTGELIAFIDSDDEWRPNKLESIVRVFEDKEIVLASSLYSIGYNEIFKNVDDSIRVISVNKLLFKNFFITSGVVCRASVLQNYKFCETQRYSEDYRLWLDICSGGYKCVLLNSSLVRMNSKPMYGSKGLSSRLYEMEKGELYNFVYLLGLKKINIFQYVCATVVSIAKYVCRMIKVGLRKI